MPAAPWRDCGRPLSLRTGQSGFALRPLSWGCKIFLRGRLRCVATATGACHECGGLPTRIRAGSVGEGKEEGEKQRRMLEWNELDVRKIMSLLFLGVSIRL